MKSYKFKILLTLSIVGAVSLSSCKKFLDVQPISQIAEEEALTTKDRVERALTGVYSQLQVGSYYGSEWPNAVWLSDDNVTPFSAGTTDLQFDGHAVLPSSNTILITWQAMFSAINQANNVIDGAATVSDITASEKANITGQALFLRALVYFDMVRTWGGVPLILTPTRGLNASSFPKRATADEVYTQIIKDLTDAETMLPTSNGKNLAQKGAAQALRARVALYRNDWPTAEAYASKLLDPAAGYSLVVPFEKVITDKNNAESIFELDYSQTDQNQLSGFFYPTDMGGGYRVGPTNELIALLTNPAIGGTRSVLIGYDNGAPYANRYRKANGGTNDDNGPVLRLAEMYLVRAEARANQGNISAGLSDLNEVRKRANVINLVISDKASLLLAIENENRLEFAFEPHRWFDLIRTNRAAAVLGVTDSKKYVFPLPSTEMLANTNLVQNAGY